MKLAIDISVAKRSDVFMDLLRLRSSAQARGARRVKQKRRKAGKRKT